jgi:CDP-6-deoxy-D-xylo-4-hexulose-3-dehydrase
LIQALLNLKKLKKGDKVGVSAVTWATNVMPLMQLGLVPVALDCSIDHLNVTSAELAKKIDDLKAVFLTNALGFCGDIDAIRELCAKKNVILLEDNCESLGTIYKGELLGNFSLASTFSFFVGHHLSTIEGGMICTDDEELYHMLLMVRAHGWDRPLPKDKQQALRKEHGVDEFHATYTFYESAYNIRATEISGMLGVLQLPMLPKTIDRREQNFKKFQKAVESCADRYHTLAVDHIERISNFAMPVITKSKKIFEETVERFQKAGVEIRPVIAGDVTVHPFWTKTLPKADCPNSKVIHTLGFYFPNNADLTDAEVDELCALLTQ